MTIPIFEPAQRAVGFRLRMNDGLRPALLLVLSTIKDGKVIFVVVSFMKSPYLILTKNQSTTPTTGERAHLIVL